MAKAATIINITTSESDQDVRDLIAQLLDLIDSFDPVVPALSSQQRADVLLGEWARNRHLPPALRLSEIGGG
jgi:hypothetical protein